MPPIPEIALVGAGGCLGAISRFLVQHWAPFHQEKALYTVAVNLTGCLAIGILWALLTHLHAPAWLHRLLIAGFLGGYTTFSSFSLETLTLLHAGRPLAALLYLLTSLLGGLLLCYIGLTITTRLLAS